MCIELMPVQHINRAEAPEGGNCIQLDSAAWQGLESGCSPGAHLLGVQPMILPCRTFVLSSTAPLWGSSSFHVLE